MDLSDETFFACSGFLVYIWEGIKDGTAVTYLQPSKTLVTYFTFFVQPREQGKANISSSGQFVPIPLVGERMVNLLKLWMIYHRMRN